MRDQGTEQAAADVASLEAALRERGHEVGRLQRDLKESERIGRELLDELSAARAVMVPHVANGPGAPANEHVLREQLDRLSETYARCEADKHACDWRIAQLERELAEAKPGPNVAPASLSPVLEDALRQCQAEVAMLRHVVAEARATTATPDSVVAAP